MTDPHIHVDRRVMHAGGVVRDMLASTFGLAADAPSVVTTGCGIEVPYAMTAHRPESVTCLPCRDHARREHLRFAEQIEGLAGLAGSPVTAEQGADAARRHRDLARRFST